MSTCNDSLTPPPSNGACCAPSAAKTSKSIPLGLVHHDSLEWKRRESLEKSRHRTEFESLAFLGRGAFGTALKVRNHVDARIYCLKSILIDCPELQASKVLRECQVLSSLESVNVVRYFGAWVEKGETMEAEEDDEYLLSSSNWTSTAGDESSERSQSLSTIQNPVCHLCQSGYIDWEVSFEQWNLIDAVLQPVDLCIPCYMKSIPPTNSIETSKLSIRQKQEFKDHLFILMEYCNQTLHQAVDDCQDEASRIWGLFLQCVQGVSYLHSKGVIHRDIKPNNIFVHDGVVKIGDLGLATVSHKRVSSSSSPAKCFGTNDATDSSHKSAHVGTFLYTAPEVETGEYDDKCDVYSLGVLLVEIFTSFGTGMERIETLKQLRTGSLQQDWSEEHPVQASLGLRMIDRNPDDRLSSSQVLAFLIEKQVCRSISLCKSNLCKSSGDTERIESLVTDFSSQLAGLQIELEESKSEVTRLRKLLDANHIPY